MRLSVRGLDCPWSNADSQHYSLQSETDVVALYVRARCTIQLIEIMLSIQRDFEVAPESNGTRGGEQFTSFGQINLARGI